MRPIPAPLRAQLAVDPFMERCLHWGMRDGICGGKVEWHHPWTYAGKQINERWAIVPLCEYHHRQAGAGNRMSNYASLLRMTPMEAEQARMKYPRENWQQLKSYYSRRYAGIDPAVLLRNPNL